MNFNEMFKQATGNEPFPYQRKLAECSEFPSLLEVPTGMGKTAAAVLAWLWRRRFASVEVRDATPRRLVYCLPMRVLVEQTRDCAVTWLNKLALLGGNPVFDVKGGKSMLEEYDPWNGGDDSDKIRVHLLMGGDVDRDWDMYPERDAILIGTQDMLLSRALNRGYAMSRYRWPVQFGLLNNDCLWVMDEVQLMGNGLATTAQLQAFRRLFATTVSVRSLWMSATIHEDWLKTVNFEIEKDAPGGIMRFDPAKELEVSQEAKNRWEAIKPIEKSKAKAGESNILSEEIIKNHKSWSRTLVIVNTVKRASELYNILYNKLKTRKPKIQITLLHSRFRLIDRRLINEQLSNEPGEGGAIIVSTQAIEAGVDISARVLFTELAPWPSLVQRFGRCNRFGKENTVARIYWIDVPTSKKNNMTPPYDEVDLDKARRMIEGLNPRCVGSRALTDNLMSKGVNKQDLYRLEYSHVIRQHDMHGLFSTESDLAGGFTDISNFIRNRERETDVQVFWRSFQKEPDRTIQSPTHNELCQVRFFELTEFLGKKGLAWEWNYETGKWEKRSASEIRPGMTLLLAMNQGGYSDVVGWTGDPSDKPTLYDSATPIQEFLFSDDQSRYDWYSLSDHLLDAQFEAQKLIEQFELVQTIESQAIIRAAWWHDIGKAIPQWQSAIARYVERIKQNSKEYLSDGQSVPVKKFVSSVLEQIEQPSVASGPWAKLPDVREMLKRSKLTENEKKAIHRIVYVPFRPNLRHEAASALVAWQEWLNGSEGWTGLAVYLIACHHGKVRTILRSTNTSDDAFGIENGSVLPALEGWFLQERFLDTSIKRIGAGGIWNEDSFTIKSVSWVGMIAELLGPELADDPDAKVVVPEEEPRRLGPFCLAFLEALVRAADVKATCNPGRRRNV